MPINKEKQEIEVLKNRIHALEKEVESYKRTTNMEAGIALTVLRKVLLKATNKNHLTDRLMKDPEILGGCTSLMGVADEYLEMN